MPINIVMISISLQRNCHTITNKRNIVATPVCSIVQISVGIVSYNTNARNDGTHALAIRPIKCDFRAVGNILKCIQSL